MGLELIKLLGVGRFVFYSKITNIIYMYSVSSSMFRFPNSKNVMENDGKLIVLIKQLTKL